MKVYMLIIMFLMIGALFIISENNFALRDASSRELFGKYYINWFSKIFDNSKHLAGNMIKLDWLPDNSELE